MKRTITLSKEQSEHYVRHLLGHVKELKKGEFKKNAEYLQALVVSRVIFLELAHDIIYIMREQEYNGYEDADFNFDLRILEEPKEHMFNEFNVYSFGIARDIQNRLMYQEAKYIRIAKEELENQMDILCKAIVDLSYGILLFKEFFREPEEYKIPII